MTFCHFITEFVIYNIAIQKHMNNSITFYISELQ